MMNRRIDRYGGSLENRTRFALQLVRALKSAVPSMIIDYKLSVVTPERGKGGIDELDAPQFAKWLEDAGVDMLHVGQANHTGNMADTIPPMGVQPYCFFADITKSVKQAVSIPVSTSGRIIDPEMGEGVLQSGKADMIGIGRALLADPDWTNKAAAGKASDIVRCISCNGGCVDAILNRGFIACVVNPENGFEGTRIITPAKVAKNVVVIGGGPAGLQAARVAAKKGHNVTLFEKEARLGGQLNIADVPPRKFEISRATEDLVHAVRCAGSGNNHWFGHRLQPGPRWRPGQADQRRWPGLFMPRRSADGRNHPLRQAGNAIHEGRRYCSHLDGRRQAPQSVRGHRTDCVWLMP